MIKSCRFPFGSAMALGATSLSELMQGIIRFLIAVTGDAPILECR